MTRDQALAFHGELEGMVGDAPGGNTEGQRERLKQIQFAFDASPEAGGYLRSKVSSACTYLDAWLSPQKWRQWEPAPAKLQALVHSALANVKSAIDDQFAGRWR